MNGPSVRLSDCARVQKEFLNFPHYIQSCDITCPTYDRRLSELPLANALRVTSFCLCVAFPHHWHPGSLNPSSHSPEVWRLCSGVPTAALCSSRGQSYASTWCSWCPSRYWSRSRLHGHPRAPGRRLQCHRPRTYDCSRLAWQRCGPWKKWLPWQRQQFFNILFLCYFQHFLAHVFISCAQCWCCGHAWFDLTQFLGWQVKEVLVIHPLALSDSQHLWSVRLHWWHAGCRDRRQRLH